MPISEQFDATALYAYHNNKLRNLSAYNNCSGAVRSHYECISSDVCRKKTRG